MKCESSFGGALGVAFFSRGGGGGGGFFSRWGLLFRAEFLFILLGRERFDFGFATASLGGDGNLFFAIGPGRPRGGNRLAIHGGGGAGSLRGTGTAAGDGLLLGTLIALGVLGGGSALFLSRQGVIGLKRIVRFRTYFDFYGGRLGSARLREETAQACRQ